MVKCDVHISAVPIGLNTIKINETSGNKRSARTASEEDTGARTEE